MSEALLRLASQIETLLPHLLLAAVFRRLMVFAAGSVLGLLRFRGVSIREYARAVPGGFLGTAAKWARAASLASFACFCLRDLWDNLVSGLVDAQGAQGACEPHSVPRPVGLAAGLGLLAFMLCSRVSVSVCAMATLLAVKDRNLLCTLATLVVLLEWSCARLKTPVQLLACVVAGAHALYCASSSSAALSVACAGLATKTAVAFALRQCAKLLALGITRKAHRGQ